MVGIASGVPVLSYLYRYDMHYDVNLHWAILTA
jgi:hypothetical protein